MKRQDDIDAALFQCMGLLEHLIGFAHPRSRADVNLEPAALGALDQLEKIFGPFAILSLHKGFSLARDESEIQCLRSSSTVTSQSYFRFRRKRRDRHALFLFIER